MDTHWGWRLLSAVAAGLGMAHLLSLGALVAASFVLILKFGLNDLPESWEIGRIVFVATAATSGFVTGACVTWRVTGRNSSPSKRNHSKHD